MSLPLAGVPLEVRGGGRAVEHGADALVALGAVRWDRATRPTLGTAAGWRRPGEVQPPPAEGGSLRLGQGPEARLSPSEPVPVAALAGLPVGTLEVATGSTLAAAALAAWLGGAQVDANPLGVALLLHLPQVMAASYGSTWWPEPPQPRRVPGGGYVCTELGAPGDADAFDRLLDSLGCQASAEALAETAQAWRLPVCPYRGPSGAYGRVEADPTEEQEAESRQRLRPAFGPAPPAVRFGPAPPLARSDRAPLDGVSVCDLTSVWAGPLATWLLGRLGASVVKVEPEVRPDGTRALHGRGVHPGGRSRRPGNDSGLFNALNGAKQVAALDVREGPDLDRLREMVEASDLVIDSFSPRVMPQLGLAPEAPSARGRHHVVHVSVPAFPPGPYRTWVAYGTGVHAMSGLGHVDGAVPAFAAPGVTYPDPLAGLKALVAALAGLAGRRMGWPGRRLEASLWSALTPLRRIRAATGFGLAPPDRHAGTTLLRVAAGRGALAPVRDGAGLHLYPTGPFAGAALPTLSAAPGWPPLGPRGGAG